MLQQSTPVIVVALLTSSDDQARLRSIFERSRWILHLAETVAQGRHMIDDANAGVVISARHLPDGSWKDVLKESQLRMVPLIVADRLADDALWTEVLDLGGFDLLNMPFEARDVHHAVSLAWRYWRDLQPRAMSIA